MIENDTNSDNEMVALIILMMLMMMATMSMLEIFANTTVNMISQWQ